MENLLIVILSILGIALYFKYTQLIKYKNKAIEALSTVDVELTKRYELIPNILKVAQRFMAHEKELFLEVTRLREALKSDYDYTNAQKVKEHLVQVQEFETSFSKLLLRTENYPELKSDQTMLTAQQSLNEVEAQIAAARRFYNTSVTNLNNTVEIFPSNIISSLLRIRAMPFFEAEEKTKEKINVDAFFK